MRTSVKKILLVLIFVLLTITIFSNKVLAKNLDEIEKYEVTVEPNKSDGSLEITYDITWKVLDSTKEGPLTWIKLGMPNDSFSNTRKVSGPINTISKYGKEYVRIDLNRAYKAGEELTFKFKFHQTNMYTVETDTVEYRFWPAWFDEAEVKLLTVRWLEAGSTEGNNESKSGKYLVWTKENMKNGEQLKVSVTYPISYFTNIDRSENAQLRTRSLTSSKTSNFSLDQNKIITIVIIFFFLFIIFYGMLSGSGRSYYGHRGFYSDDYYDRSYHSSCVSSCACASSCASSCACACAGSGRAGCSLKDFYGTNITTEKIKKAFEK